jgi:hypothetical protein
MVDLLELLSLLRTCFRATNATALETIAASAPKSVDSSGSKEEPSTRQPREPSVPPTPKDLPHLGFKASEPPDPERSADPSAPKGGHRGLLKAFETSTP